MSVDPQALVKLNPYQDNPVWMMNFDRETMGDVSIGKLSFKKYLTRSIVKEAEKFDLDNVVLPSDVEIHVPILLNGLKKVIPILEEYLRREIEDCRSLEVTENLEQCYSVLLLEKRYMKDTLTKEEAKEFQAQPDAPNISGFIRSSTIRAHNLEEIRSKMFNPQDRIITSFIRTYFFFEYLQKCLFPSELLPTKEELPQYGSIDSWKRELKVDYDRTSQMVQVVKNIFIGLSKDLEDNCNNVQVRVTVAKITILLHYFFKLNFIYTFHEIHKVFDPDNEEYLYKKMEWGKAIRAEATKNETMGSNFFKGFASKFLGTARTGQEAQKLQNSDNSGSKQVTSRQVHEFKIDFKEKGFAKETDSLNDSTRATEPDSSEPASTISMEKSGGGLIESLFRDLQENPKRLQENQIDDYFELLKDAIGKDSSLGKRKESDSDKMKELNASSEKESGTSVKEESIKRIQKIAKSFNLPKTTTMNPKTRKGEELQKKMSQMHVNTDEKPKLQMKIDEKQLIRIDGSTEIFEPLEVVKVVEEKNEDDVPDEEIYDENANEEVKNDENEDPLLLLLGLSEEGRKNPNLKNLISFENSIEAVLSMEQALGRSDYFPKFSTYVSMRLDSDNQEAKKEQREEEINLYKSLERQETFVQEKTKDMSLWTKPKEKIMYKFYSKQLGSLTWDTKFVETNDKKELMAGRKPNFKKRAALIPANAYGQSGRKSMGNAYVESLQKYDAAI